ncbi:hypothetical protein Pint_18738 [Pistacia integerrima]|uniref:Uncharacterized protein n=1 Tax=Pistacia integerrima TaxID=434235 RepID=A0ACC0YYN4_9ROSI|nr:hypothetical protein Pint_18738 [Pistacia integerrima]
MTYELDCQGVVTIMERTYKVLDVNNASRSLTVWIVLILCISARYSKSLEIVV